MKCNKFYNTILYMTAVIFVYIFCLSVFVYSPGSLDTPAYFALFYLFAIASAAFGFSSLLYKKDTLGKWVFISLTVIAASVLRIAWILAADTDAVNDFKLYNEYAADAANGIFNRYDPTYTLFPFKFGYPLILSLPYRLFGSGLLTAKLFNVFISACLIPVIYRLAEGTFNENSARIACLLFTVWPSQIMYSSVLGSEHLFTLFICMSISLFIANFDEKGGTKSKYLLIFSGAAFAFSYFIKPTSAILIPAFFIYLLMYRGTIAAGTVKKVKIMLVFIFSLILVLSVLFTVQQKLTGVNPWRSSAGFNLLVGTNYKYWGKYNEEDGKLVQQYENDFEKFHSESESIALDRIRSTPGLFLKLIEKKCLVQWANDDFGYYWSALSLKDRSALYDFIKNNSRHFYMLSFFYYALVLFFAAAGCVYNARFRQKSHILLLLLVFDGIFAAHAFLEVQPRYHYPAIPLVIAVAGYGLNMLIEEKNKTNTEP